MLGLEGFAGFAPEVRGKSRALKCTLESILITELLRPSRR